MKNFIPLIALLLLLSACSKQEMLHEEMPQVLEQEFIPADQMPAELLPDEEELRANLGAKDNRFCCGITSVSHTPTNLEAYLYVGAAAHRLLVHHYERPWNYIGSSIVYLNIGPCSNILANIPTAGFTPQDYISYFEVEMADHSNCGGAQHYPWTKE